MITLRHFTQDDVESIRNNLYSDMTESEIANMITEWNSCVYQGRYFEMLAVISDGRIVGYVSLYEHSQNVASAGIEIYCSERKKGIAFEAMNALLDFASEKGYRLILDQVLKDNQASIKLHDKLGFESDGYVYRNQKNKEIVLYMKLL